jgi:phosphatidylserine/phosphatidylglycerophosphate/cardiolipin synthase-like enzyme
MACPAQVRTQVAQGLGQVIPGLRGFQQVDRFSQVFTGLIRDSRGPGPQRDADGPRGADPPGERQLLAGQAGRGRRVAARGVRGRGVGPLGRDRRAGGAEGPAPGPAAAPARPADYWRAQLRYGLAGNSVRPLVDGKAALKAIKEAIETASGPGHFVYLLGWWVDPWVHLAGPDTCLLNLFARAAQRGVQIRVLMWDSPSLIYPGHSKLHDAAVTALNKIPNCYAQQDAGGGLTSTKAHHQKLVVVQGSQGLIALCGGVDVNADRLWDKLPPPASAYRPDRPNVGWNGASGSGSGPKGEEGIPFHDVHSRLSGPTARPLLRVFLRRWWARSGDRDIDRRDPLRGTFNHPVPPVSGHDFVRVGETFDGVLRSGDGRVVASRKVTVQDIWLRSILGARRFIYIEDQYLISDCAARAIRVAMARESLKHVTILIPRRRSRICPASGNGGRPSSTGSCPETRMPASCTSTPAGGWPGRRARARDTRTCTSTPRWR